MIFDFPVTFRVRAKNREEAKQSLKQWLDISNVVCPGSIASNPKFQYTIGNPICPPDEPTVPKPKEHNVMDKSDITRDK
jgi:hypothetical protein